MLGRIISVMSGVYRLFSNNLHKKSQNCPIFATLVEQVFDKST